MKGRWRYSKRVVQAFLILLAGYVAIFWMLQGLDAVDGINFDGASSIEDLDDLLVSIPLVAFYILVLIAATAGFARGSIMAKQMPFSAIFKQELRERSMERASIRTKIRSGNPVSGDTAFMEALDNLLSSRIPILGVVDNNQKVTGVITHKDFLTKLQYEMRKEKPEVELSERLKGFKALDLNPSEPVVAYRTESLQDVLTKMTSRGLTKLMVVDGEQTKINEGTVDVLDLVAEMLDDPPE